MIDRWVYGRLRKRCWLSPLQSGRQYMMSASQVLGRLNRVGGLVRDHQVAEA
jgi:hypothetical protein